MRDICNGSRCDLRDVSANVRFWHLADIPRLWQKVHTNYVIEIINL